MQKKLCGPGAADRSTGCVRPGRGGDLRPGVTPRRLRHAGLLLLALVLPWPSMAQQEMPPTPVRVAPVIERAVGRSVDMVGSVRPYRASAVASQVTGWVARVDVEEGSEVAEGDLLALLDDVTLQTILAAREADLAMAETEYSRAKTLIEEGAISDLEFLRYKTDYDVALAERDRAAEGVRNTRILAPFSGVITKKYIERGEWVTAGTAVIDLLDLSRVRIIGTVTPEEVGEMRPGILVTLRVDAYPDRRFEGRVDQVIPSSAEGTRGFPVHVIVPNDDRILMAGMLARVEIETSPPRPMLMVPKDAVVFREGRRVVYRLNESSVEELEIDVTLSDGLYLAIVGDLEPGESVVVVGNESLMDGMSVVPTGS